MATQGSYRFHGIFFFIVLCTYCLKYTWSASESLLPIPEEVLVIECIDFGRVASGDTSLLLLLFFCPPPLLFFFFPYNHLCNYKEMRTEAGILETFCHVNSSGLCLPQLVGLSATSQRPSQCLTTTLELLKGKQRISNHCGLDCLCPKREIYKSKKTASRIKIEWRSFALC